MNLLKRLRKLASVLAAVAVAAGILCSCGSPVPKESDAKKYVQAVMDMICTGEYDSSVKFADIEEGMRDEMIDQMVDEMIASFGTEAIMTDEIRAQFRDFLVNAFSKCKYVVGDPVKTEDGGKSVGYDVPVTIEPLMVFAGASDAMQTEIDAITSDTERLMNMTEDDLYAAIFNAVFKVLNSNLEDPQYAPETEVAVHYGIIDEEKNAYGVSEEDGSRLGERLFSAEGAE